RHRHGENGRLGDFGEPQLFLWAFKTELREVVTERAVGFVEGLPGHWIQRRQLFAHADSLRALPGKKKCDFFFPACVSAVEGASCARGADLPLTACSSRPICPAISR